MKCEDCIYWEKRQIPKKEKEYFPAGICTSLQMRDGYKIMLTVRESKCSQGLRK